MDEVRKTHPGPSVFNAIFTRSLGVGLHQVAPWSHMHLTIKDTPAASFQAAGCAGCRHAANLEIP